MCEVLSRTLRFYGEFRGRVNAIRAMRPFLLGNQRFENGIFVASLRVAAVSPPHRSERKSGLRKTRKYAIFEVVIANRR